MYVKFLLILKVLTRPLALGTFEWLKEEVYLPLKQRTGNEIVAIVGTNIVSAFWHGFAPGYYLTFVFAGVCTYVTSLLLTYAKASVNTFDLLSGTCRIELLHQTLKQEEILLPSEQAITLFGHMALQFHRVLKEVGVQNITKTCCSLGQIGEDSINIEVDLSDNTKKVNRTHVVNKSRGCCY